MERITFDVPAEILEALKAEADLSGRPFETVAAEWLAKDLAESQPRVLTPRQRQEALERLQKHFGSFRSDDPHSADNERIDEDLAREYGKDL